jgi:ankyrin repeat protein
VVVRLLLEIGADANTQDEGGLTPLSVAAKKWHEVVVKMLLEWVNVNPDLKDDTWGQAPLLRAAQDGMRRL